MRSFLNLSIGYEKSLELKTQIISIFLINLEKDCMKKNSRQNAKGMLANRVHK